MEKPESCLKPLCFDPSCLPESRYVAASEQSDGLAFDWPSGDRTLVQVDHSSVSPDSTNLEVMSLYRFLVHLERVKRLSEYKISYSDCSRKVPTTAGVNVGDGFNVCIKESRKYKTLPSPNGKASAKAFFAPLMQAVESSEIVSKVFRFRFERVHASIKIQKPYCMLTKAISVKANQPTQIG